MLLPSVREGYGLVVIEAARSGTPSVVVAGADNAGVELVEEGVNGFVAPSGAPEELAAAIVRVHEGGPALRDATAAWFARNAGGCRSKSSLERVAAAYGTMIAGHGDRRHARPVAPLLETCLDELRAALAPLG